MTLRPDDRVEHPEAYRVPTEEDVPNAAKPLPTSRNTVFILCFIVMLLIIAAVTTMWAMDWEVLGFVLALGGVLLGILGIVMAYGDARVTMTTPVIATVCAGLLTVLIGMDMGEVDDALEGAQPASAVIGPDVEDEDLVDENMVEPDVADDAEVDITPMDPAPPNRPANAPPAGQP